MNKKSKVTEVQSNGTWEGNYGTMYKYEIVFENGDCGEYSSKSEEQTKFVIGEEVEYTYTGGKFPKVKPVYIPPAGGNVGGYTANPNREDLIIKQTCIKAAAEIASSPENAIKAAEQFYAWIKGAAEPEPVKSTGKKETTNLPF